MTDTILFTDYLDGMGEIKKVNDLARTTKEELRPEQKEKAEKDLRKYAFEIKKKYDPDNTVANPDELSGEQINDYIQMGQKIAQLKASNAVSHNLEGILADVPTKTLENLAGQRIIAEEVPDKYRDVIQHYQTRYLIGELAKRYKAGEKPKNEQEAQLIEGAVAVGAGEALRKRLKDQGFGAEIQEIGAKLVQISSKLKQYKPETERTYALAGFNKQQLELKKKYESGDVDHQELREGTVLAYKSAVESEDPKKFNAALSALYTAHTGKDLVDRDEVERSYEQAA